MTTLMMTLALILTIVLSLAIGIAFGYYAILGILNAFSIARASKAVAAPVLVTSTGTRA